MSRHFMVDIETLDTRVSAVVASIAIVEFTPGKPQLTGTPYFWRLALQPQLDAGRTISEGTLEFWFEQKPEAQRRAFVEGLARTPEAVLADIRRVVRSARTSDDNYSVWGNGAGFDNAILHDLSAQLRESDVWSHWRDMCFRTFKNLHDPQRKFKPTAPKEVAHDPVEDALFQIEWFNNIAVHNGWEF